MTPAKQFLPRTPKLKTQSHQPSIPATTTRSAASCDPHSCTNSCTTTTTTNNHHHIYDEQRPTDDGWLFSTPWIPTVLYHLPIYSTNLQYGTALFLHYILHTLEAEDRPPRAVA